MRGGAKLIFPKGHDLSAWQRFVLVTLRLAIGWHLLSEGLGKIQSVRWTSAGYLASSFGPFADLFHRIPAHEGFLKFSDAFVMYGLTAAGAMLLLGLFTRLGCLLGLALITMFYISMPPWEWVPQPGTESNYFIVNKNVIEGLGLVVVMAFPTGRFIGLDSIVYPLFGKYLPCWAVGYPSREA